jgi:hypothetical protein
MGFSPNKLKFAKRKYTRWNTKCFRETNFKEVRLKPTEALLNYPPEGRGNFENTDGLCTKFEKQITK